MDKSSIIEYRTEAQGIPDRMMALDIGNETIKQYCDAVRRAKTIFWNGPLGVFEVEKFAKGSMAVLEAVIEATDNGAISVVGGGDTLNLIQST